MQLIAINRSLKLITYIFSKCFSGEKIYYGQKVLQIYFNSQKIIWKQFIWWKILSAAEHCLWRGASRFVFKFMPTNQIGALLLTNQSMNSRNKFENVFKIKGKKNTMVTFYENPTGTDLYRPETSRVRGGDIRTFAIIGVQLALLYCKINNW